MIASVSLALALALSPPKPSVDVAVGEIGSRAFVVRNVGLDRLPNNGQALRGWLCRRAPGAPVRRLAVIAEDRAGKVIWKDVVAAPAFAPGRSRQCRPLRIDLPPDVEPRTALWRLERP